MKKYLALIALVTLVSLATTGCKSPEQIIGEKVAESVIESSTGGNVDLDNGSVSIKTGEGELNIGSTKVPDNWPSNVPTYSGATVASSMTSTGSKTGKVNGTLAMTTTDAPSKVMEWYGSHLSDWTKDPSASYDMSGSGSTISMALYKNADNSLQLTITAATDASNTNQTTVTLNIADTY